MTEDESIDGSHGSTFTVRLPLGKAHLPAEQVDDQLSADMMVGTYGQGILDEARQWGRTRQDERTPSELSESGSGSDGSRVDRNILFFSKHDVIMIGEPNHMPSLTSGADAYHSGR